MPNRILLIYKKSAYQIYVLERRTPSVPGGISSKAKDTYRALKGSHDRHHAAVEHIRKVLSDLDVPYDMAYRAGSFNASRYELVISVGGDGTFLEAARHLTTQPLLGVNSDPTRSVGAFCAADPGSFGRSLKRILSGRAKPVKLNRFRLTLNGKKIPTDILNDVLICHENPAMMSRYSIRIGASCEEHRDSGLWISTAAGSTGGIRSAGGRVMPVLSKALQYQPRELYPAGRHYRLRGGLVAEPRHVRLVSLMRGGRIYLDGPHVSLPFQYGDRLELNRSPYPLKAFRA